MKVTVDGAAHQIHIGCRSFVLVTQLIELLNVAPCCDLVVTVNGKRKERQDFASTSVKERDRVTIKLCASENNPEEKEAI